MNGQYTPGPLEARRNRGPGNNGMTRIFAPNGDIVAEVHAKADAVLFAAAPDLAEALRAYYLAYGNCGSPAQQAAAEKARAALEKAGVNV